MEWQFSQQFLEIFCYFCWVLSTEFKHFWKVYQSVIPQKSFCFPLVIKLSTFSLLFMSLHFSPFTPHTVYEYRNKIPFIRFIYLQNIWVMQKTKYDCSIFFIQTWRNDILLVLFKMFEHVALKTRLVNFFHTSSRR